MSDNLIENPWIIVHQPGWLNGKMETILGSLEGHHHSHFGLAIADVIRHVAQAYDVDEADVLQWVHEEMDDPTTELSGKTQ